MNLSPIIQLIDFFGKEKLVEIAEQTGLLKRQRKLMPDTILKVFTFGLFNSADPSLKQIVSKCRDVEKGLKISKQAIHNKLDKISDFLKEMFGLSMNFTINESLAVEIVEIISQFKDVKIYDSSRITLPDKLAEILPGLGGRNSDSSLRIQACYSLLSKIITSFELTESPGTDASYNDQILKQTEENELIITDLGYFNKDFFTSLEEKGAYFLSRVRKNAVIGTQKNGSNQLKRKQFLKLLKDKQIIDTQVFVGGSNTDKLECRLVGIRLPEEVVNEKRREANKKAKSKGKQLNKYETELLAWHIVITNVPASMLSAKAACDLYRARWQIELVFKACKSYLNIDKVGRCGEYQLECLIYGRLIAILLTFRIYNHHYPKIFRKYNRGISILLFMKLLSEKGMQITMNLVSISYSIKEIAGFFSRVAEDSVHEKRKEKTTLQILMEYKIPSINYQKSA